MTKDITLSIVISYKSSAQDSEKSVVNVIRSSYQFDFNVPLDYQLDHWTFTPEKAGRHRYGIPILSNRNLPVVTVDVKVTGWWRVNNQKSPRVWKIS